MTVAPKEKYMKKFMLMSCLLLTILVVAISCNQGSLEGAESTMNTEQVTQAQTSAQTDGITNTHTTPVETDIFEETETMKENETKQETQEVTDTEIVTETESKTEVEPETQAEVYTSWQPTEENDVCDILMIGNSFCQNYCDELYAMAKAAGFNCRITSAVVGACTLEMHWDYYSNRLAKYSVITYDANGRLFQGSKTLQYVLSLADWDVISYQDGEHYYRTGGATSAKEHMEPSLGNLVTAIRGEFPNATHYFQQVWAYQVGYYRPEKSDFKVPDSTVQATMHQDLRNLALYGCESHNLLRIPTGDAWAYARADSRIGDVLCMGDNEHDSERTGGQYLNACVWFETLFGKSCEGNFIDSPYLSEKTMTALQEMAHRAVADACGDQHAHDIPTLTFPEDEPPEETIQIGRAHV